MLLLVDKVFEISNLRLFTDITDLFKLEERDLISWFKS